jgi:hypothetical protein
LERVGQLGTPASQGEHRSDLLKHRDNELQQAK